MNSTKGNAPVIGPTEALSETQSTNKGNHMSIIALQPSQPNRQPATMTSREIAELTGKELSNVHRDIREMLDALKKDDSNLNHPQEDKDARGYTTCFYLNRELTDTLLTGYNVVARNRVIKRWHELEGGAVPAALNLRDPKQLTQVAAQLLALTNEQATQIVVLERQAEVAAPKVDVYERIVLADGDMPISLAAKSLGIDPLKRLFQWLHENGWIYKRLGSTRWLAHQDKIKAGLLDHRNYPSRQDDGTEKLYPSVVVTPKGLASLAQKVPKEISMPTRRNGQQPHQPGASA